MGLLARENLVAWEVASFDTARRTPGERAHMLAELGIKRYAYIGSTDPLGIYTDVNTSHLDAEAEIRAMQAQGIEIQGWYVWLDGDDSHRDPAITELFETFQRHQICPRLWVSDSYPYPRTIDGWGAYLPKELAVAACSDSRLQYHDATATSGPASALSAAERVQIRDAFARAGLDSFPTTADGQANRVRREADRIENLARMAETYGCGVDLYNHRLWFGAVENQLAVIAELRRRAIEEVGLVYNFIHAVDAHHNDAVRFDVLWQQMMNEVSVVNVTGICRDGTACLPSQGDYELAMVQAIARSQWRGAVGFPTPFMRGDIRTIIEKTLDGLDALAARL